MRISNFTGEKNTYNINVFLMVTIAGEPTHFGVMLRAVVHVPHSNWTASIYFYAYFAANILGSAESFPQALRETLRLKKKIQESNTIVKEWYFKKSVCEIL